MRISSLVILVAVAATACGQDKPAEPPIPAVGADPQTQPLPNPDAVRCQRMLTEIRTLRDGPQPCSGPDDCTVWHNGEHWDGCPVEVNKANGAALDRMRQQFEALGCPVDSKGAACAAQEVMFCVTGGCGGKVEPLTAGMSMGRLIEPIALSFDDVAPGAAHAGMILGETAGRGTAAVWQAVPHEGAACPCGFGTVENKNYGRTFSLALADGVRLGDLDLRVRVKAVAGKEDQGGGPVWRARDADNYYIARWNPLEDNFRIYCVKDGERRQIATTKVKIDPREWHEIRIVMRGAEIQGWLDGAHQLEVDDATFPEPGLVGLWVKADAQTLFDELRARPAP